MPLTRWLRRQSTLSGVGTLLFVGGVAALIVALYRREPPYLVISAGLLLATIVSWCAAAQWGTLAEPLPPLPPRKFKIDG